MAQPPTAELSDFVGLKWVRPTIWGAEPRWTIELDNQAILSTIRDALNLVYPCEIEFLASGAMNKVFVVKSADRELVARVTLPVDPKWKTMCEVASLKWVSQHTDLPVPEMPGKPLGDVWRDLSFEARRGVVRQLATFCAACFQHQFTKIGGLSLAEGKSATSTRPSKGDGDDQSSLPGASGTVFEVGRIVSMGFFWEDRIHQNVNRGPFSTSKEWLSAKLDLVHIECSRHIERIRAKAKGTNEEKNSPADVCSRDQTVEGIEGEHVPTERFKVGNEHEIQFGEYKRMKIEDDEVNENDTANSNIEAMPSTENEKLQSKNEIVAGKIYETGDQSDGNDDDDDGDDDDDEDDLEDLEETESIISRLRSLMDDFFPANETNTEPTMLFHEDLSFHNALVSEEGHLTAVVDWECISLSPIWLACQYPLLLHSHDSEKQPDKNIYRKDENGDVDELYWEHLTNWELTQLRRYFLEEMKVLAPGWVEVFQSSERLRDFFLAVETCDDYIYMSHIVTWLNDLESGDTGFKGLRERVDTWAD
ncbi:hypothetical protein BU24DRAFT_480812 [Aaosphaeria arxii CBS 175.79]|uniref:Aminoglycoside phosphotransferase domain-containing protein n=1 Tax=Aaosphaeria arxii CBS 175.79 TaxID=1450172 RepID=A0A6A5XS69_9PLEO|nr:uncharacterized protein BU24DRAFT_480812 [Aaosphaeria arxii CBS 175.79]KAF2016148.1 hypothetical protein BU24DRAFT_480812 [Aaosphaeria arxii CBS 175.79]